MKETYSEKVKQAEKLLKEDQYSEASSELRKLSCRHLRPTGLDLGLDEIARIFPYSDISGPCLYTPGEKAEDKSTDEERKAWDEDSRVPLDRLYKCVLTGEDCVARKTGFHCSDIPAGDYHYVFVEMDVQGRCPAYEGKGL